VIFKIRKDASQQNRSRHLRPKQIDTMVSESTY